MSRRPTGRAKDGEAMTRRPGGANRAHPLPREGGRGEGAFTRRSFVSALPALAAGPYLGSVLTGCGSEPLTGPGRIIWDRDVCVRCSMVISDRAYAAQIRDPMKKVLRFDDFGCAVFWKEHQSWSDADIEFWAVDSRAEPAGSQWLDARKATFAGGKRSPMGYGFAAVPEGVAGAVTFAEARKAVLAKGK